jgi:hypothetical protein
MSDQPVSVPGPFPGSSKDGRGQVHRVMPSSPRADKALSKTGSGEQQKDVNG